MNCNTRTQKILNHIHANLHQLAADISIHVASECMKDIDQPTPDFVVNASAPPSILNRASGPSDRHPVGATVRCRCGGPLMEVSRSAEHDLAAAWYVDGERYESTFFHSDVQQVHNIPEDRPDRRDPAQASCKPSPKLDPEFQIGDVVQLHSGGPDMTVTDLTPAVVGVEWFDGKVLHGTTFKREAIRSCCPF